MSDLPNSLAPWRRFRSDEFGLTAVEFGFLAPIFFWLVFVICQIGLYMYNSASLAYATNGAARKILTGAVANTANLTADIFRNQYLCPLLPGSMSCGNVVTNLITIPAGGSFYGLPAPAMNNANTSFCIGQPGSYVILQVYYAMPVIGIPAMLSGAVTYNGAPSIFINANTVFENEPFSTSYSGC